MRRRRLAGLLFALALLSPVLPAPAQEKPPEAPAEPIRITAKRMEVKGTSNVVLFEEEVVATQGAMTLSSDKLKIVTGEGGGQQVKEMIATGHVQFHQVIPEEGMERFATGKKAHYWDEEGKLELTGSPRAWENDNEVTGEVMTFFTRQNVFLVDGQVKVVFFPEGGSRTLIGGDTVEESSGTGESEPQAPEETPVEPGEPATDPGSGQEAELP